MGADPIVQGPPTVTVETQQLQSFLGPPLPLQVLIERMALQLPLGTIWVTVDMVNREKQKIRFLTADAMPTKGVDHLGPDFTPAITCDPS
jgi:hypothetical protein